MLSDKPAQTHSLTRAFTSRNDQAPIVGILTDTQILTTRITTANACLWIEIFI